VANRKGPTAGYNFPAKVEYRERVWKRFRQVLQGYTSNANALLMPSVEAVEVEVAERHGFKRKNLYAVDMNVAIAATISRRYPGIKAMGRTVASACEELSQERITLRAANFDFCGNFGATVTKELGRVGRSGVLENQSVVAVTLLRGRESSVHLNVIRHAKAKGTSLAWWDFLREGKVGTDRLTVADGWRIWLTLTSIDGYTPLPLQCGSYLSVSGQSMLWVIARLFKQGQNDGFINYVLGPWMAALRSSGMPHPDSAFAGRVAKSQLAKGSAAIDVYRARDAHHDRYMNALQSLDDLLTDQPWVLDGATDDELEDVNKWLATVGSMRMANGLIEQRILKARLSA
jgi:hypothetical protein